MPEGKLPLRHSNRPWAWAVGVVTVVLTIIGSAVIAHALVERARQADAVVAAPALPALPAVAVAHPEAGALFTAYDPATGNLATLASQREPSCPPVGACQPVRPDAFVLLNGSNGQSVARTPLTGDASAATDALLLLDDPARQRAYAISPGVMTRFSTANGALASHVALAHVAPWTGGALDAATGHLYLVGGGQVVTLDVATGDVLAEARLPVTSGMPAPDGPIFDAARRLLYIAIRPKQASDAPQLLALDAATLRQVSALALPVGARLGPLDAETGALDIFGGDGRGWQIHGGQTTTPTLVRAPMLDGALAVGANPALRRLYIAGFTQTRSLDTRDGRMLAGLPLVARWPTFVPLPVDEARGLLYLPSDHGAIVIIRDGAGQTGNTRLTAPSAAILARAALAKLLPDTNQDPPFVAPDTFPLGAGTPAHPETRALDYWIHFANRGWQGPYPGTASVAVTPDGAQPGGHIVTFTITWRQLFERTHTWVCAVAPSGAVALRSETGDTVP
ncbi:MAG TPA: hypothetical protein VFS83_07695 [Ktedonobacterales bacterium]|nr:hypothetical protein [Ktedonobacterales bacterium]